MLMNGKGVLNMDTKESKTRKTHTPINYLLERGIIKLEEVHSLYKTQGANKTAEFYNISVGTLYTVLKAHGISDPVHRTVISKLNDAVKREVLNDLGSDSARSVSNKHGLSYSAVCKLAKENGVKLHRAVPWDAQEACQLISELQNSSLEKVASKHGYPVKKLTKLAKLCGLQVD
jgi:hypothetical protein